jgi:hypothetical protein
VCAILASALLVGLGASACGQTTCREWTPGLFPVEGFGSETTGYFSIDAFAVGDDGRGRALFAGGEFEVAGGAPASRVARWDGRSWSPLGEGFDESVYALESFDDGNGPAVFAGGTFRRAGSSPRRRIARWNGSDWSSPGIGLDGDVYALRVFDDGSGSALYVGGDFIDASGVTAYRVAKWDGRSWSRVGIGVNDVVRCFAVFDDGSGSALYAGGDFTTADDRLVNSIARWNGSSWSPVGTGMDTFGVRSLAVFDDGTGPALYAGGDFALAGGIAASRVARWNGSAWSAVGGGTDGSVVALGVFDGGAGPQLFAGGLFATAGGVPVAGVARWDGATWSPLGPGVTTVYGRGIVRAFTVHDDGSGGPALFAGGTFTRAGDQPAHAVARWRGEAWSRLGTGIEGAVTALAEFDDGGGNALWVGGAFGIVGDLRTPNLARFDGQGFHDVVGGLPSPVTDFLVFDDGTGSALYASTNDSILRWNGSAWTTIGSAVGVRRLAAFDDGSGPTLYATGSFSSVSGNAALYYARWNGTSWSGITEQEVDPLDAEIFDDGTGPALYGCGFSHQIARWDGHAWSHLTPVNLRIFALASYDDGSGPALYAGGSFTAASGRLLNHVGRWNGTEWTPLAGGVNGDVYELSVADDGSGPALYAGGYFTQADGRPASALAKWDGTAWSALGSGVASNSVAEIGDFDDGNGRALYVCGGFERAGGVVSGKLARWGATPPLRGSVNALTGPVADALFANGSAGDASRVVRAAAGAPITLRLATAPLGPATSTYVLWAWLGAPANPSELRLDGATIGCFANPTPFRRFATPQPFACMHGAGVPAIACGGARVRRGPSSAPWTATIASGFASPRIVTLQAVVEDSGAGNPSGVSATNAVILDVR